MFGDYTDIKEEYESKGKFIGMWIKDKPLETMQPYLHFYAGMFEVLYINDPNIF